MSITSHVAGPLGPDRIQRCARCFAVMKDVRREGIDVVYGDDDSVDMGANWQAISLMDAAFAHPCLVTTAAQVIDELTYRSYRENRRRSPHIAPERWGAIYSHVEQLEARYQNEETA